MRKLVSALAIATGLVLLASPAHAQDPYPPSTEGLTVSESTVSPGESLVVSGDGAEPGATVVFTLTQTSSALGSGARVVAAGPALARAVASVRPLAQGSTTLGSITADPRQHHRRQRRQLPSDADHPVQPRSRGVHPHRHQRW
jgi:hypothetical protein